jgi:8-oxo-dGTP diphosphatase
MIRRYGEAVKPGQSYRRRPGVYAILLRGDDILLTHQAEPDDEFQLPGGGIVKGENPITALHREVMEETGWHITDARRFGAFRRFCFMPDYGFWAEKLCTIYIARPTLRISAPTEAGHAAHWMPAPLALEVLGNAGDRALLARALYGPR